MIYNKYNTIVLGSEAQLSTVQYSVMHQCSAVKSSTSLQCSTVQKSAVQYHRSKANAVYCVITVERSAVQPTRLPHRPLSSGEWVGASFSLTSSALHCILLYCNEHCTAPFNNEQPSPARPGVLGRFPLLTKAGPPF